MICIKSNFTGKTFIGILEILITTAMKVVNLVSHLSSIMKAL